MRRKELERREAIFLRQADWPLRRIALELGVSVSSVSVWVRNVPVARRTVARTERIPDLDDEPGSRLCGRCNRELPLGAFSRHPKNGRQGWCKECFRAYFRARGDVHRKQSAAARRKRRAVARKFVDEYLTRHPCVDCGEADPLVLEFDHIRSKSYDVSVLIAEGFSVRRIEEEIKLCEVVCASCHRRRTARRTPSWRSDPSMIGNSIRLTVLERRNMLHVYEVLSQSECRDCGCQDLMVLEFDHVGSKRGNVMQLARNGCSFETLLHEIDQCEVRCANCHRRRTRTSLRDSQTGRTK
jgi:hypothetical protein